MQLDMLAKKIRVLKIRTLIAPQNMFNTFVSIALDLITFHELTGSGLHPFLSKFSNSKTTEATET